MPGRSWSNAFITLLLGLLVAIDVSCGLRGIGFGSMWDEGHQVEGLKQSVRSVSLSPIAYYYGGFYYVPGYLLLAPKFLRRVPTMLEELRDQPSRPFDAAQYPSIAAAQREALDALGTPGFLERDRSTFVWLVALSIPAVFGAGYWASGSRWAALCAAGATALSWEVSYHARFIAVDSLLALFGALVFLFIGAALGASSRRRERLCLGLAAGCAGLGLGCKMPGVFLLLPVLVALAFSPDTHGLRGWFVRAAKACALALLVFVATTPGSVLDPLHYANDMFRVASDYNAISDDYAYCEPRLALRLLEIAAYWGTVLFSPYLPIALGFAAFVVGGSVVGVRERRPAVLALLTFLVAYVAFVASQRLLIVRNLMVTVPALAILASVGVERCAWLLSRRWQGQALLAAGFLAAAGLNASWLWSSAHTVGTTSNASILQRLDEYLGAHRGSRIYVSPAVMAALRAHDAESSARLIPSTWHDAREVVMYADALPGWKANTPRFATYFSSLHANYDYYPGLLRWSGLKPMGDPILLLSKDKVIAQGVTQAPPR